MMKRWLWLALLPLILAAKAPTADPESLLRQGNDAFDAGQVGRAADLFDRASVRTVEPSLAAFNLATARYRQAREGNLAALGEAEIGYRSCLEEGDPHRTRALYGLGTCLLLRATAGTTLDRATLRAAIDRFSECLRAGDCDEALAANARYNRARAKLLLLQSPPAGEGSSDEPPDGDDPKKDDSKDPSRPKNNRGGPGTGKDKLTPGANSANAEQSAETKEGTPGPGKGVSLPPVSDDKEPIPLAKDDAARHVELAVQRILDEARTYRRGKARPAAPGVRDW